MPTYSDGNAFLSKVFRPKQNKCAPPLTEMSKTFSFRHLSLNWCMACGGNLRPLPMHAYQAEPLEITVKQFDGNRKKGREKKLA